MRRPLRPRFLRRRGRARASLINPMVAALNELSAFSDAELADIGLSRSCLSPEGLVAAARRRARGLEG
ncbi:MAG: DUF1127 domain-containing protein [Pseudomonadota bacterium]